MNALDKYQAEQPWSSRELEIVGLLAEGLTNREIAGKLILSPETIKWYNKQIFDKLGVNSRTEAAAKAREFGLLDEGEPAEAPVSRLAASEVRLPAQLTSFVGRQRELAEVKELLKKARLVTLTGPGGTGKTRLSLQVAAAVAGHYAHGVTFIGLASTVDPMQVPGTIAHELGLTEQPGQPLPAMLGRYFEAKNALLVLDNYEHVLEAAPLVSHLLAAAPRLTVLATSREVLRLSGEYEYPVPPLVVPDPDQAASLADLPQYESVELFLQRAQAAKRDFTLTAENASAVARICARLDGLPLAIELAAARLRLFAPEQLLARLDSRLAVLKGGPRDLPARQRTLRDTIDWSYQLLDEDEKRLFWRLGVFIGGRTIAAIEAICGPGLAIDPLDGLESLLHKSLIYQEDGPGGEPRFIMLETIHEFAHERLAENGEEQVIRDRHLAYFLGWVEEVSPGYYYHDQQRLLEQTEAEKSNLLAAFEWGLESGQIEAVARLVSALHYFWYYYDSPVQGFRWFERALLEIDAVPRAYRPRLLLGAGRLAWLNGDLVKSRRFHERALTIARELEDKDNEAWAQMFVAGNIDEKELFEERWRRGEEGLAIFRSLGNKPGMAQALNIQGELARTAGNNELARQKYEQSLAISRETGEAIRQNMLLGNLAMITYNEEEYGQARDLAALMLEQFLVSGTRQGTISAFWALAGPLCMLGQPVKAARLLGASAALFDEMGAADHPTDYEQVAKYTAEARAQLGESAFEAAWKEGQTMTLEEAVAYAQGDEPFTQDIGGQGKTDQSTAT
ncbi:MAG: LuxR C-terminal-related transcriptional regulator, partial [Chloroflexota bacterium]